MQTDLNTANIAIDDIVARMKQADDESDGMSWTAYSQRVAKLGQELTAARTEAEGLEGQLAKARKDATIKKELDAARGVVAGLRERLGIEQEITDEKTKRAGISDSSGGAANAQKTLAELRAEMQAKLTRKREYDITGPGEANTSELVADQSRLKTGAGLERRNPVVERVERMIKANEENTDKLAKHVEIVAGKLDGVIAAMPEFRVASVEVITA